MRKMKDSGIEWIGEIPDKWGIHRVKNNFSVISGSGFKTDYQGEEMGDYPVCKASDISNAGHRLFKSANYISQEIQLKEGFSVIPSGSILFAKIGEAMKKNNRTLTMVDACADNNCQAMLPKEIDSEYAYYLFECIDMQWFDNAGTIPCINNTKLLNFKIAYPSLVEQSRIADYLDQKCAEIDAIIAAKEKTNELLKERRQSIIYEAVTKGLDPTVPMKDSGIEWIGEIPESWSFSKLKYDAYMKGRIGWQGLKADEFIEEGPYLVTGTDFEDGKVRWERSYHISEERFNEAPEIQLKEQDLLITKDGTIGKLAYIDYLPGLASLNSHLLVIRPKRERFLNKYLYWVLSSDVFFQYTEYAQDGTIMASLSQEKISQFVFGLPTIEEQQAIANYLDEQCAEIDSLISANESTIEKLKEYRQSVIYEAVTGKMEV
ncbi:MAG: restriction endonuclease subunit S [Clostridia bacterium]|nr:restriction endonuclease subunit S [Clostridia bacterium]